jgi:hypothetical protein
VCHGISDPPQSTIMISGQCVRVNGTIDYALSDATALATSCVAVICQRCFISSLTADGSFTCSYMRRDTSRLIVSYCSAVSFRECQCGLRAVRTISLMLCFISNGRLLLVGEVFSERDSVTFCARRGCGWRSSKGRWWTVDWTNCRADF